jgi:hypothetical protein
MTANDHAAAGVDPIRAFVRVEQHQTTRGLEETMTRVEQLEQAIEQLKPEEFAQLRDWLLDRDWAAWDQQLQEDITAGRLDKLADEALAEHACGETTEL